MDKTTGPDEIEFYVGQIMPWPGPIGTIPEGWMLCAGQVLTVAQYEMLASVIGISYGAGGSQGQFQLPNLATRIPIGQRPSSSSGVPGLALGATGGQSGGSFTLPVHSHAISYPLTPNITATSAQATIASPTSGTPVMLATPVAVDSDGIPLSFDIYASPSDAPPDILLSSGDVPIGITIEAAGNAGSTVTLPTQGPYIALNYIICFNGRYPQFSSTEGEA